MKANELRQIADDNNQRYQELIKEYKDIIELCKEAAFKGEYSIIYRIQSNDTYEWGKHQSTDRLLRQDGFTIQYLGRTSGYNEYRIAF